MRAGGAGKATLGASPPKHTITLAKLCCSRSCVFVVCSLIMFVFVISALAAFVALGVVLYQYNYSTYYARYCITLSPIGVNNTDSGIAQWTFESFQTVHYNISYQNISGPVSVTAIQVIGPTVDTVATTPVLMPSGSGGAGSLYIGVNQWVAAPVSRIQVVGSQTELSSVVQQLREDSWLYRLLVFTDTEPTGSVIGSFVQQC